MDPAEATRPGEEAARTGELARRRRRRDRHGRGLRRPLLPTRVPNARTRAQEFDEAVLAAVTDLEAHWGQQLEGIEFAVDEVPALGKGRVVPSSDVVLDAGVPLSRFSPPGVDRRGRPTRARIVIYRKPVESRAVDGIDIADLIAEILAEQVASSLGEPEED